MKRQRTDYPRPDIFIIGVMKGGTTILHDYICTHPKICAGSQKEIHYFSLVHDKGPDWYASHFEQVPPHLRTIDASPTYFDIANTAQIPRLIKAHTPNPRVIVITRDPIERAISQFVHLKVTTSVEALKDVEIDEFFAEGLACAYRQNTMAGFFLNQVLGFSLYARKFVTYKQILAPEQLLAISNEQLRKEPERIMRQVFDFLGEDPVSHKSFGEVRYSTGSSIRMISRQTYDTLAELLYPDYRSYCHHAGLPYAELAYEGG